jgi:uncharacterized protein
MLPIFATFDYSYKNCVVCGLFRFCADAKLQFYSSMEEFQEKPVWLVLLLVIVGALTGFLMGQAVGVGLASLIYQGDIFTAMQNPTDEALKIPMFIIQGTTSLGAFLLAPYFVWNALRKKGITHFRGATLTPSILLILFGIVVTFAVVDSAIIDWNQHIHFPDFLKSFEEWARAKEDQLAELTKMFTNFRSPGEFIFAFVIVAILAGICEEFFFRGIIQAELFKGTGNIHLAIWISAFLFSAIHAQFFGFVPRILLGGLFGYLYYWSGNLLVPVLAHLFNNGFSLTMVYLYHLNIVKTDIESPEAAPWPAVVSCIIIVTGLLYFFKKRFSTSNTTLA